MSFLIQHQDQLTVNNDYVIYHFVAINSGGYRRDKLLVGTKKKGLGVQKEICGFHI